VERRGGRSAAEQALTQRRGAPRAPRSRRQSGRAQRRGPRRVWAGAGCSNPLPPQPGGGQGRGGKGSALHHAQKRRAQPCVGDARSAGGGRPHKQRRGTSTGMLAPPAPPPHCQPGPHLHRILVVPRLLIRHQLPQDHAVAAAGRGGQRGGRCACAGAVPVRAPTLRPRSSAPCPTSAGLTCTRRTFRCTAGCAGPLQGRSMRCTLGGSWSAGWSG
jgi:hypothetical protein